MDDWGLEIGKCFRVTDVGAETFDTFDRELLVIGSHKGENAARRRYDGIPFADLTCSSEFGS